MNVLHILTAIFSFVSCSERAVNTTWIMGNWILDEIRPIIRIRKPRGFSIVIPDPTPIEHARFCYKIGRFFRKGEKAQYSGEFERVNDTLVYIEPNFKEDTTVAYYFEIELKNGTKYITRHYTNIFEIYKIRPNWTPEDLKQVHFGSNSSTYDWKKSDPNVFYMEVSE